MPKSSIQEKITKMELNQKRKSIMQSVLMLTEKFKDDPMARTEFAFICVGYLVATKQLSLVDDYIKFCKDENERKEKQTRPAKS